ncbi:hypothetical protein OESDEN_02130 [Oesophagostomum dentatum]|uniref:ABC transporter, ATP-binding protein n=1 Tax=Oesophagostomum dentatum TaxID=61180 RepID=A0A0B1TP49_OESDE|nr:hypothetical protein OESDEN_02130 [Oesophagostomum dentatum]
MRVNGRAILLSSHSMEECEALCSRIGVLVKGRLVAIGTSQELKSRYTNSLFLHIVLRSLKDRELIANEVLTKFPSGTLVTKRIDSLSLKFKICRGAQERLSTLYAAVQEMASHLPLSDFFLLQSSLEDVLENLNELYSGKIL